MKIWVWGYSARMKRRPMQKTRRLERAPRTRAPAARGPSPMPKEGYPMRLNKYLAHEGVATRRDADLLIEAGKVRVNGRVAELGQKVEEGDIVELSGKRQAKRLYYFAYHKPVGVITHSPQGEEEDVRENVTLPEGMPELFPVGRLDKDSHGLMILTNDGRITDRLLNPAYDHEKEYRVKVEQPLRESFAKSMSDGVLIEDYMTQPCHVEKTGERSFTITLAEGKKHQIRRMVAAHHNVVTELERVRIMNITLGTLKPGALRPIEGDELAEFLASLDLA